MSTRNRIDVAGGCRWNLPAHTAVRKTSALPQPAGTVAVKLSWIQSPLAVMAVVRSSRKTLSPRKAENCGGPLSVTEGVAGLPGIPGETAVRQLGSATVMYPRSAPPAVRVTRTRNGWPVVPCVIDGIAGETTLPDESLKSAVYRGVGVVPPICTTVSLTPWFVEHALLEKRCTVQFAVKGVVRVAVMSKRAQLLVGPKIPAAVVVVVVCTVFPDALGALQVPVEGATMNDAVETVTLVYPAGTRTRMHRAVSELADATFRTSTVNVVVPVAAANVGGDVDARGRARRDVWPDDGPPPPTGRARGLDRAVEVSAIGAVEVQAAVAGLIARASGVGIARKPRDDDAVGDAGRGIDQRGRACNVRRRGRRAGDVVVPPAAAW